MRAFLPPETSWLLRRISARNARRARLLCGALRCEASTAARREAIRALEATLGRLRGAERRALLLGPDFRAWLSAIEEALALLRPPPEDEALFETAACGPYLRTLTPRGRVDRTFRRRAAILGGQLLEKALRRLPPLLAFHTPLHLHAGPLPLDLEADGEEARVEGEWLVPWPVPMSFQLEGLSKVDLAGGGIRFLQRDLRRRRPRILRTAPGGPRPDGASLMPAPSAPAPSCRTREVIPGSEIIVARRAVSTRRGLRPGRPVTGFAERLGEALVIVGQAWPEAHAEILAHTRVVVPFAEPNTVSYSLPDRPGTSYIGFRGKSIVDLADDLLHETAHHRLHGLEEIVGPLDRGDAEPRYRSPWRRSVRPLRGVLHAAYTFTWRAELLRRLPRLGRRLPKAWIRREAAREIATLRQVLADLLDAERRSLLTPAGSRLRRAIAARVASMKRR